MANAAGQNAGKNTGCVTGGCGKAGACCRKKYKRDVCDGSVGGRFSNTCVKHIPDEDLPAKCKQLDGEKKKVCVAEYAKLLFREKHNRSDGTLSKKNQAKLWTVTVNKLERKVTDLYLKECEKPYFTTQAKLDFAIRKSVSEIRFSLAPGVVGA